MPSSCRARMTRTATSPRFATRTRENISGLPLKRVQRRAGHRLELEQELPELDRLRVLDMDRAHEPRGVGLHLVHELHRLEDAQRLSRRNGVTHLDERRRAGLRRAI